MRNERIVRVKRIVSLVRKTLTILKKLMDEVDEAHGHQSVMSREIEICIGIFESSPYLDVDSYRDIDLIEWFYVKDNSKVSDTRQDTDNE